MDHFEAQKLPNKAQKQELEAANSKIVDLVAQLDVIQAERDDLKIDIAATTDALSQIKNYLFKCMQQFENCRK